jgi:hypothetical protein
MDSYPTTCNLVFLDPLDEEDYPATKFVVEDDSALPSAASASSELDSKEAYRAVSA